MTTIPEEFFNKAVDAENRIGKLYSLYSAHFGDDGAVSEMYSRLAMEEHSHAGAFRKLSVYMRNFCGDAELKPKYEADVERVLMTADQALAALAVGVSPSLREALQLSVRIETELIEQDRTLIFGTHDVELLKTLVELRTEEEGHKSLLLDFMVKRNIPNA